MLFNILGKLRLLNSYDQRQFDMLHRAKVRARVRSQMRRLGR